MHGNDTPGTGRGKVELRNRMRSVLRDLSEADLARKSRSVVSTIRDAESWRRADTVFAYHPFAQEVDLLPLLHEALLGGKQVCLPRMNGSELVFHFVDELSRGYTRHTCGMQEPNADWPPVCLEELQGRVLVLAPGLAFDRHKNRLGRGKGCYDRFIRRLRGTSAAALLVAGVAFGEQLVGMVPHGESDEPLDLVFVESEAVE